MKTGKEAMESLGYMGLLNAIFGAGGYGKIESNVDLIGRLDVRISKRSSQAKRRKLERRGRKCKS
jgi:hypothetical protein